MQRTARLLTAGEIAMASLLFGGAIDFLRLPVRQLLASTGTQLTAKPDVICHDANENDGG